MKQNNEDVFTALLSGEYDVALVSSPDLKVRCRRMPFTTMMYLLSEIVGNVGHAIVQKRTLLVQRLFDLVLNVNSENGKDVAKSLSTPEGIATVFSLLEPFVNTLAGVAPNALERVLVDIIVGGKPETVRLLSAEDGLAILNEAFSRMDKTLIAKQVRDLFFGLRETAQTYMRLNATTQPEEKVLPNAPQE